ncbi:MAG: DUF4342 domain-containing protein [Devosia sp.]
MTDQNDSWKTFTDQIDIAGHRLIDTVTGLVGEGNVRTLRIRTGEGHTFLEIPLMAGAVAGGIVVLTAPWLAAIGAIAGIAGKVSIEVVRDAVSPEGTAASQDVPASRDAGLGE